MACAPPTQAQYRQGAQGDRCTDSSQVPGSFFIELANQEQGEIRPHVFEVRAYAEVDAIPAWLAVNITDNNPRRPQWTSPPNLGAGVFLVRDVLANPLVEFQLQVRALFPRTQLLALQNLEVVSQARLLIERFIRAYEPRLKDARVRALPCGHDPLVLAFVIEATLCVDGVTQPVVFSACLQDAGKVEVLPDVL